jgi:hypothetical protein
MITLSPTFIRSVRLFVLEYFKALSQLRRATLAAPYPLSDLTETSVFVGGKRWAQVERLSAV